MSTVNVVLKHQGKKYNLEVDPESTGEVFRYQIFSLTGVEPERQKVLFKGAQIKNDTLLSTCHFRPNDNITVMGTPSSAPGITRPAEKIKFVEDMTEAEAAQQTGATPPGLVNLGNTCYLNATLQVLRCMPELQHQLATYTAPDSPSHLDLVYQLRSLYEEMSQTQEAIPPLAFLSVLRSLFPQFAERARDGRGFAQQDAEEAWTEIVATVKRKLPPVHGGGDAFITKYMGGRLTSTLECDDPAAREAGEQPQTTTDLFFKLDCHINKDINHLRDGLLKSLTETGIEKKSDALDRTCTYTKQAKISHLPKYLTVHFVRFYWKRLLNKKAKIMKKVTYPHELDAVEFCTDELRKALVPVRDKVREIRKEEEDIERARKRRKKSSALEGDVDAASSGSSASSTARAGGGNNKKKADANNDVQIPDALPGETFKTDAEVDAEKQAALLEAKKELHRLIDRDLAKDEGANQSGLYELRGVVTHQGASASSGHYTAYVKKTAPRDPKTGKAVGEEDGKWWWFNDDSVTEVTADKIDQLAGGGESHSALILLYRAIPLPMADGKMETE